MKKDSKKVAAGKLGGQVKSEAKARASRQNGATSEGRPKGIPTPTAQARKGALARAAALTPERRREIALKAVAAREAKRKKSAS